jgi:photosystem II stability/assembly factor-like uncharacterized protein
MMKPLLRRDGTITLIRRFRLYLFLLVLCLGVLCPQIKAVSWFAFGPDGGSARAFAADPQDHLHLYMGAANGWIYQSRDGGKKWERLARVGKRDDLVIDNILVDPTKPKHLVVGAWVVSDGGGIFVSDDGGVTWAAPPEMMGQSVRALAAAPSDPKTFVAGTLEGVFRSADSGAHWERISPKGNAEIHEIESLAIDPSDPKVIYAGTWHLPWKTTNGGRSWSSIKQGIIEDSDVFSIIVDPKKSSVVYLSACSGIYKREDAGAKFAKGQGIPSTARRTRVLMQDPNNLSTVYAGTTEGLYRTFDAGKYWVQTTSADVIVNDVYVDPANSKHVLLATDRRGVLASDDGGDSFQASNTGFSARLITAFAEDVQHPAIVYVGVVNDKDAGGVFVSRTGGLSWSHLSDGLDGRDVFSMIQAPDGTILAGTERGIYRLNDALWQRVGDDASAPVMERKGIPATGGAAVGKKPAPTRRRAAARHQAAKPHAATASPAMKKAAVVKNLDGSVYGFARVDDTLYAATSQGLLRSVSSGTTWSVVAPIPLSDVRFVAAEKETLVAAGLNALAMSADGGKTWQTVSLPDKVRQVSAVAVDGRGDLWVGDKDGVYCSGAKGAHWQPLTDLVVRKVNSLYFDERANRMLVTASEPVTEAFAVDIPSLRVKSWDTGWNLRFLRPVGDHLVGATLFDGIVVQPRMVDSAELAGH